MKPRIPCRSVVLFVLFAFISIECNHSSVESTTEDNLLLSEKFKSNNTPTFERWRVGNPQLAQLVNEAPSVGGNWSLQLTADQAPTTGFVYTPVAHVTSGDVVKLSAFVCGTGKYDGKGVITLAVG